MVKTWTVKCKILEERGGGGLFFLLLSRCVLSCSSVLENPDCGSHTHTLTISALEDEVLKFVTTFSVNSVKVVVSYPVIFLAAEKKRKINSQETCTAAVTLVCCCCCCCWFG